MAKTKTVAVRMDPTTYADLRAHAEAQGLGFSAYVRKMLFFQTPYLPIYEDVRAILEEANRHITTSASGSMRASARSRPPKRTSLGSHSNGRRP